MNTIIIDKKELERIFRLVRKSGRQNLEKLPASTAAHIQSGWLMGYADCWNKLHKAIMNYRLKG